MQCNCNCRLQTDPARINISNVWCLRWYDTIFDIITRVSSRHLISQELYCNSMHFVIRLVSGLIAQRHTALTRNIFNKSWVSTSRYESNSVCLSICWFINRTENLKFPNTGLVINSKITSSKDQMFENQMIRMLVVIVLMMTVMKVVVMMVAIKFVGTEVIRTRIR